MAFSEQQKAAVRKRAHFRCCLCHSLWVDIHHIVPQAEGGSDEDDNAAPLCPSCHETYGANPGKRKFIREARDFWYETCEKRFASDKDQLAAISDLLRSLATKEDLQRMVVQNSGYVLGAIPGACGSLLPENAYSFEHEEFVHPLIVRELLGWLSDPVATIVAVDLTAANRSNRFFGEFSQQVHDGRTWIRWQGQGQGSDYESFSYAHVGISPSGIHMVECFECGGGTGVFGSVALFALESDRTLVEADRSAPSRARLLLKTVGVLPLGDRYCGKVTYADGLLTIGPDEGEIDRGNDVARTVPIK